MLDLTSYMRSWHRWYWFLIPILTIAAYLSVLRIGFLADDFTQLNLGHVWGLDPFIGLASDTPGFLRPVGFFLTYQVGWFLWGYNPLPYHIIALLLHAASAMLLGFWLATITRKPSMGWLAGVLFGVFPLHLEAVGWVAAQFDTYSVFFGLASLYCFTLWWLSPGRSRWGLYILSLALYILAIFTKESFLTFIPVYLFSVWFSFPPSTRKEWLRLGCSVLPFLFPIGLDLGYRYVRWGTLGGYTDVHTGVGYLWENFLSYAHMLLSPLNESIVGPIWVQATFLFSVIGLSVLLILYGRQVGRLLVLVGVWLFVAIVPVLGLALTPNDIEQRYLPTQSLVLPSNITDVLLQNRYLYLVSVGMMVGLASLLHTAMSRAKRTRSALITFVALLIFASSATCWVQLRPWHTATVQTEELIAELLRIAPAHPRPNGMAWYVDEVPSLYKGVFIFLTGLGISRIFQNGEIDYPQVERTSNITQSLSAHIEDPRDTYVLRFGYDGTIDRFIVDYAAGITSDYGPPTGLDTAGNVQIWDFRSCGVGVVHEWEVSGAESRCIMGNGLSIETLSTDPQLISSSLKIDPESVGAKFVRVRVSVSYTKSASTTPLVSQWFWSDTQHGFEQEDSMSNPIKQDGKPHTYWFFIPVSKVQGSVTSLRFDPVNAPIRSEIEWIAVDTLR